MWTFPSSRLGSVVFSRKQVQFYDQCLPPKPGTHACTHTEVMLQKNLLTLQSRLFQEHSYMQDHWSGPRAIEGLYEPNAKHPSVLLCYTLSLITLDHQGLVFEGSFAAYLGTHCRFDALLTAVVLIWVTSWNGSNESSPVHQFAIIIQFFNFLIYFSLQFFLIVCSGGSYLPFYKTPKILDWV